MPSLNRRKFLKVMGAGVAVISVTPLGGRVIETFAASQAAAPTVNPLTHDSTTVAAPARGLGSNSNYYLTNNCNPVPGLSITLEVTKDIISDIGFSIQLNAYSPLNANSVWQQYIMMFTTSDGSPLKISAMVDNWPTASFRQSQNQPSGSDLINHQQLMLTLPGATLPAGYKATISLEYDKDQNVNGAKYVVVDPKGKTTNAEIKLDSLFVNHTSPAVPITTVDLDPINAFELNIVGPTNGKNTYISAGAGTITYNASSPLTVMSKKPACCAAQSVFTEESANTVYGTLPGDPSQKFTQSFDVIAPNAYAPGGSLAVVQQAGSDQTALLAVNGVGQLAVFTVQGNGHWHSEKPKGSPALARPNGAVAASPHFGTDNQTDAFLIDQNGQLNVFSAQGSTWNGPQTVGPKNVAHPGAYLAASKHFGATNQTDVFVVDSNGQLNVFSAIGSGKWNGPQTIGPKGVGHSGGALAVSQRFGVANQTDVFLVDDNGQLNVFSAIGSGKWNGPQTIGAKDFAPSAAALAVSQHFGVEGQMDVFLVDNKGQLNVFSADASGKWNGPQPIGTKDFARAGANLAASQDFATSSQTDVFVVDKKGQLNVFSAVGSGAWSGPQPIGAAGVAPSGAVVVASQQFGVANQTDVFVISQPGGSGPVSPVVFATEGGGTWTEPKTLANDAS